MFDSHPRHSNLKFQHFMSFPTPQLPATSMDIGTKQHLWRAAHDKKLTRARAAKEEKTAVRGGSEETEERTVTAVGEGRRGGGRRRGKRANRSFLWIHFYSPGGPPRLSRYRSPPGPPAPPSRFLSPPAGQLVDTCSSLLRGYPGRVRGSGQGGWGALEDWFLRLLPLP